MLSRSTRHGDANENHASNFNVILNEKERTIEFLKHRILGLKAKTGDYSSSQDNLEDFFKRQNARIVYLENCLGVKTRELDSAVEALIERDKEIARSHNGLHKSQTALTLAKERLAECQNEMQQRSSEELWLKMQLRDTQACLNAESSGRIENDMRGQRFYLSGQRSKHSLRAEPDALQDEILFSRHGYLDDQINEETYSEAGDDYQPPYSRAGSMALPNANLVRSSPSNRPKHYYPPAGIRRADTYHYSEVGGRLSSLNSPTTHSLVSIPTARRSEVSRRISHDDDVLLKLQSCSIGSPSKPKSSAKSIHINSPPRRLHSVHGDSDEYSCNEDLYFPQWGGRSSALINSPSVYPVTSPSPAVTDVNSDESVSPNPQKQLNCMNGMNPDERPIRPLAQTNPLVASMFLEGSKKIGMRSRPSTCGVSPPTVCSNGVHYKRV
eukprot:GHVL01003732.1.p1 GENE.GHVL01003732.1~~GHVL01003732.1.p1  ORF type:complete len:440 (+),score=67.47 GHVL01003732.1:50-1369(+)